MFDLSGRKALITGASGGIGESIVRQLHSLGAEIFLHGTREEKLNELVSELGSNCHVITANLADRSQVKELAKKVEEKGGVDILVNNAGITKDGLFIRMKDEDWDQVLAVNLTAVFNLTKDIVQSMMKRRYGRIINISSVVGVSGNPGQVNYCTTKAGIIGFSKALAQEVASRNITVNAIAPGFIETAMTQELNEKQRELILARIPQKRMGKGADIANAVAYLASDASSYITGQTLHVNGGMYMV
ncbi:3-oxoacyl-[acyl-carrier-protein] reductase [Bartonella sp. DGB1]|uniref:3-oxoacyl-[acyl-carrier-protein] reductase n=1 Tax=Bartonella sp. DGB1 TaxID=3239807 RepID=UPI003523223E